MSKKVKSKKGALTAISGILLAVVLLDFTPLGGNIVATYNLVKCGGTAYRTPAFAYGAQVPSYEKLEPRLSFFQGYPKYFCTPEQAERAGYSADPKMYDFPHLPKSEWESAVEASKNL